MMCPAETRYALSMDGPNRQASSVEYDLLKIEFISINATKSGRCGPLQVLKCPEP